MHENEISRKLLEQPLKYIVFLVQAYWSRSMKRHCAESFILEKSVSYDNKMSRYPIKA